jgi:hypothetical protein
VLLPGSLTLQRRKLTSMEHGPVAQLSPAAPSCKEGIIGYHGGVVASPSPSAF